MPQPQQAYRHVPYDIDVEQALLGSLLVDNALIDTAAAELEPEFFYDPLHARLFEMICCLFSEGAVTPLIVHAAMKADAGLLEVGGHAYLAGLAQAAPALPNVRDLAKILQDLATRRALIHVGEDLVNAAYATPSEEPTERISLAAADAILAAGTQKKNTAISLGKAVTETVNRAIAASGGKEKIPSIPTGITAIDSAIGGMQPGDRIGVAARTGMGKSILASVLATSAALAGHPVYIASGDMRLQQWSARAVCELAQRLFPGDPPVPYGKFRKGGLTAGEIERLIAANEVFLELPILIDDNPVISIQTLRGRARAMARRYKGKQGLLVVDFLQNVKPPERRGYRDRRQEEDLTQIAYEIGNVGRDIGWTTLSLVQLLNKGTDVQGQVATTPPSVADIRASGGIEQALDIIVGLYRPAFAIEHNTRKTWPEKLAELKELHVESGFPNRNLFQTLGFKNRDMRSTDLDLNLWCDMSCGAVRDEAPYRPTAQDQDAADPLVGM